VILVVLVILVFLQKWRAAIIPVLAIPVSLIGTFAVLARFGYSSTTCRLFGWCSRSASSSTTRSSSSRMSSATSNAACPARGRAHLDGRSVGRARRDRARALRGVRADPVPHRPVGRLLPAVRGHHLDRDDHLAVLSLTLSPALAAILLKPQRKARPQGDGIAHPPGGDASTRASSG
jgi:hypothetical protein